MAAGNPRLHTQRQQHRRGVGWGAPPGAAPALRKPVLSLNPFGNGVRRPSRAGERGQPVGRATAAATRRGSAPYGR